MVDATVVAVSSAGYGLLPHLLVSDFYGVGDNCRFIAEGVAGYPALPALSVYTDPGYDDTGWPVVELPVFGQDYVDDYGFPAPPPGTTVPAGSGTFGGSGPGGSGHWVARMRITFPDYTVPAGQHHPALPGEKPYLLSLTTDNNGDVYIDGEQVIFDNTNESGSDHTNCYLVDVTPGEHLVVIDKSGDTSTDYLGCQWNVPAPLDITVTVPAVPGFALNVAVHNASLDDPHSPGGAEFFQFDGGPPHFVGYSSTSRELSYGFTLPDWGSYTWRVIDRVWTADGTATLSTAVTFDMLVQTSVGARLVLPLHLPKPGAVAAGVLAPVPAEPPPGPPADGTWFVSPFDGTLPTGDGFFYDGYYNGAYLRLFHAPLLVDLTTDMTWVGPVNAADNRVDGTGFFLEVDMFAGPPGDPSHGGFGFNTDIEPWDHNDRYRTWTGTQSDGAQRTRTVQNAVAAGTSIWLLAQQWPYGDWGTLPLDPSVSWNPAADMGSWLDADNNPMPMPWHLAALVEVRVPVPSTLWGP